jgi:hypothetical protein
MTRSKATCRSPSDESLTTTVVRAVADAKGVDPLELEECLYDVIDPDALERLFAPTEDGARRGVVVFRLAGCRVEVDGTDRVVAERVDEGVASPVDARV